VSENSAAVSDEHRNTQRVAHWLLKRASGGKLLRIEALTGPKHDDAIRSRRLM
jgi:hypothetical protein